MADKEIFVYVDGVDRSGMLDINSLKISWKLGQRATCSFKLNDTTNTYKPDLGNSILIVYDDGDGTDINIFKGTVDSFDHFLPDFQADEDFCVVSFMCVDRSQLADRFLVAETFEVADQVAGDIVTLLLADYLAADGITAGDIQDGPLVSKAVYNYVKLTDVLNELAERSGFLWYIDANDQLYFIDPNSTPSPFELTDASKPFKKMVVKMSRSAFRNRQYLRGGMARTDSRVEQFAGDGVRRNFNLIYPVAEAPTVTVEAIAKTVGIRGVDTGKDFYWNKSENEISQDDAATPVADGDEILVTYVGLYPLLALLEDGDMIDDRIAAEGGTGVYEMILNDSSIDDQAIAQEKLQGLLTRYASLQPTVTFETDNYGLKVGQLLTLDLLPEQAYGDALLTAVTATFMNEGTAANWFWRSNVTGSLGPDQGGWAEFLKKLFGLSNGLAIRENEISGVIRAPLDGIILSDSVSLSDTLSDGSDDPYTAGLVSNLEDDPNLQYGIDDGVVGDNL